jgi:hypothetical protein
MMLKIAYLLFDLLEFIAIAVFVAAVVLVLEALA